MQGYYKKICLRLASLAKGCNESKFKGSVLAIDQIIVKNIIFNLYVPHWYTFTISTWVSLRSTTAFFIPIICSVLGHNTVHVSITILTKQELNTKLDKFATFLIYILQSESDTVIVYLPDSHLYTYDIVRLCSQGNHWCYHRETWYKDY